MRVKISRLYNGVNYSVEATLEDVVQCETVGKVIRAVEQWIDKQTEKLV